MSCGRETKAGILDPETERELEELIKRTLRNTERLKKRALERGVDLEAEARKRGVPDLKTKMKIVGLCEDYLKRYDVE